MTNILITGGTGFIGRHLSRHFIQKGHHVVSLGSSPPRDHSVEGVTHITADTTQPGAWQTAVPEADILINLAGRTIFKRWTRKYKKAIFDSRILTTRNLVSAMSDTPAVLINASAVGYYGHRDDDTLTELDPPGTDFLADVCRHWEDEAQKAQAKNTRVLISRFGVVLGPGGGAMAQMIPLFKMGLGGPVGSGSQWFPWMHIDDLAAAIEFLIDQPEARGPFNFCGIEPIRNKDFAKTLGKAVRRPAFFPAPAFMLKLAMGEFGSAVLSSQRAVPRALLDLGFSFQYPTAARAVEKIVSY